jgi:Fe-Mn family superoxide dismutase
MKKLEKQIQQLETQILENHVNKEKELLITEMKKIGIEKLPYSYSALKQFIDPETMDFHYNKHYKGYVDKLNYALSKKKYGDVELEQIIKTISRFDKTIRNNAGGAFNHALFWNMLTPKPKKLEGELLKKITKQFGSFTTFKKEFDTVAKDRFGSGWVWLVLTAKNTLKIMSTPNQDNPLMNVIEGGGFPILGLDLWEHAYYLKYRNKRDEYIVNFWKVVNWEFVSKLYEMRTETKLLESVRFKQILSEGKSEMCSSSENEFYAKLYDNNQDVKWTYRHGMDKILKAVFLDNFVENPGEIYLPGFYDIEGPGRSLINNINTNYSVFCVLVNDINQAIKKIPNKLPINFKNKNPQEQVTETKRFLNAINYYKKRIFDVNSETFKNLIKVLDIRERQGRRRENSVSDVLVKNFGDSVKSEMVGGPGIRKDALGGIDIKITLNGVNKTAQIKGYSSIEINDDNITIIGSGIIEKYNTDWMIFENNGKVLIFDNKIKEIVNGKYVFPSNALLYKLQ